MPKSDHHMICSSTYKNYRHRSSSSTLDHQIIIFSQRCIWTEQPLDAAFNDVAASSQKSTASSYRDTQGRTFVVDLGWSTSQAWRPRRLICISSTLTAFVAINIQYNTHCKSTAYRSSVHAANVSILHESSTMLRNMYKSADRLIYHVFVEQLRSELTFM